MKSRSGRLASSRELIQGSATSRINGNDINIIRPQHRGSNIAISLPALKLIITLKVVTTAELIGNDNRLTSTMYGDKLTISHRY